MAFTSKRAQPALRTRYSKKSSAAGKQEEMALIYRCVGKALVCLFR